MASRKYKRILEAAKYYSAIDNYIQYITDASKRGQNVGNGTARAASKILFLFPFAYDLGVEQIVKASANEATYNLYKTELGTNIKDSAGTDYVVPLAKYSPARVNIVTGRGNGVAKTSAVTGLKYLSYGGKSTSVPFGRATVDGTDTETAIFGRIKAAILAKTAGAIVTLKSERF